MYKLRCFSELCTLKISFVLGIPFLSFFFPNVQTLTYCTNNEYVYLAKHVNAIDKQYQVLFLGIETECMLQFRNTRRIVLQNYSLEIDRNRAHFLYTQPFTIVFVKFAQRLNYEYTYVPIRQYSANERTIFVFLDEETSNLPLPKSDDVTFLWLTHWSPALKLIMYLRVPAPNIKFLCHLYCSEYQSQHAFNANQLLDPEGTHKMLFWNANQREVTVSINTIFHLYFVYNKGKERYSCLWKIHTLAKNSHFCEADIMTSLTLATLHNISMQLFSPNEQMVESVLNTHKQFMEGPWVINEDSMKLSITRYQSFSFAKHVTTRVVHCMSKGTMELSAYLIWYLPLSFNVWVVTVVLILLAPMTNWVKCFSAVFYSRTILNIVEIFFGQISCDRYFQRYVSITIAVVGFLIASFYREVLTSFVAIILKPQPYTSLKAFLMADNKIIHEDSYYGLVEQPEEKYMQLFKSKGIEKLISNSFRTIAFKHFTPGEYGRYLVEPLGLPLENMGYLLTKEFIERSINSLNSSNQARCYAIPDPLKEYSHYWIVATVNKLWLHKSIMRMHDAGLSRHWDDWSAWMYKFQFRDYEQNSKTQLKGKTNQINYHKFAPCIYVWIGCLGMTLICFLAESDYNKSIEAFCILLLSIKYILLRVFGLVYKINAKFCQFPKFNRTPVQAF